MRRFTKVLMALSCAAVLFGSTVHAAELQAVMNAYTGEDAVTLFVKNQEQNIDHVYIGNDEVQEFSVEEAGPVRTVVMLDNSLSIPEEYRETIKSFLKDLVAETMVIPLPSPLSHRISLIWRKKATII